MQEKGEVLVVEIIYRGGFGGCGSSLGYLCVGTFTEWLWYPHWP